MLYKRTEHIRKRVSLVVQVLDDVTNKMIYGSIIQVELATGEKPIQKSDGYYVFLNVQTSSVCLCITSPQFVPYKETIQIAELNPLEPVVKIRLKPNRFYPFQQSVTCLEGRVRAGAQVRVLYQDTTEYFRLIRNYIGKQDKNLYIFNPSKQDLEEKWFHIVDSETQQSEDFMIGKAQKGSEDCYELSQVMEHSYQKHSSRIYPVACTKADKEGYFFMTLPFLEKEHTKVIIQITGRKKTVEQELVYGQINTIT